MYELYNTIAPLVTSAFYSIDHYDLLSAISDKIFNILKDWSHGIYLPKTNVSDRAIRFADIKYGSKLLGFVRKWNGDFHDYKLIDMKNSLMVDAPLLWLHVIKTGSDIELLVYPDGSLIVDNFPIRTYFDDIRDFGGVRILKFCKECNELYRICGGNLSSEEVYNRYEDLVNHVLHDLQYMRQ